MTNLNFDVFWRDRGAVKGLKDLGKSAEEGHRHVKTLGDYGPKLAGAFAGFAAVEVFHDFISGAREANAAARITSNVIKQTGGAAHVTSDQVTELTKSLAEKTGVDDDVIRSGANMILTFTGVRNEVGAGNDIFNQATTAAEDMAAAMNNGQVTTDGIRTASIQLGKALNDPIAGMGALRRVGVSFDAQQQAQIKTLVKSGHTLEAQKLILAEVKKEFGGTAAAASDPMQRLAVITEDLGKQVGQSLLPAVTEFADFMANTGAPMLSNFLGVLTHIPAPAYAVAAGLVGITGAVKAGRVVLESYRQVSEATSAALRLLGLRAGEAAAGEAAEGAAAGAAATSTAASGDAAAVAGTKFGTLAGKLGLAGAVVGLAAVSNEATSWLGRAEVTTTSTQGLADAFLHLSGSAKAPQPAIDAVSSGMDKWYGKVQSSTDVMNTFGDLARGAFSMGWSDIIGRAQSGTERVDRFNGVAGQMDAALAQLVRSGHGQQAAQMFDQLLQATGLTGDELDHVRHRFLQYEAASADAAAQSDRTTAAIGDQNSVLVGVQRTGNVAAVALHGLAHAGDTVTVSAQAQHAANAKVEQDLATLADRTLTLRGADRDLAQSKDDLTASIKSNGRTLSDNTAKGRANSAALDQVASATLKSLAAHQASGEPLRQYAQRVLASRNALIREAEQAGMNRAAAKRYADAILAVPRKQTTTYTTPGATAAKKAADSVAASLAHIQSTSVKVHINADGNYVQGSRVLRARGGAIPGFSPSKTADNIPLWGTAGEHMWSVDEVQGAGGHAGVAQLRSMARARKLAAGGAVDRMTTTYDAHLPSSRAMQSYIDARLAWGVNHYRPPGGFPTAGGPAVGFLGAGGGNAGNMRLGQSLAASYGWAGQQWLALRSLWMGESGWNNYARNPSSGAFGIPQALPPGKMGAAAVAGSAYAQIIWGLRYIRDVYGSPGRAWSMWNARRPHWYDDGGVAYGSGFMPKRTSSPERVLSPRQTAAFERLVPMLGRTGGAGGQVSVTVQLTGHAIGFQDQIVDAVRGAVRSGRLNRAVLPGVRA